MYTQFFGLREKPFAITPDPQYLYLSNRHGEALAHLLYGVTESGGFIQLTGEVGTGKTLLTRSLLDRLPEDIDLAVILNPRLSAQEFLETLFDELHIAFQPGASIKQLIDQLNEYLLDAHVRGRRTVLLVDEAQNLGTDVLEQVRLLTNLETTKQKLLQIILVGQPELRQTLARNDLRQLAQRITGRYHLGGLTRAETNSYIEHRLKVAGAQRRVFTRRAVAEVFKVTGGTPRIINVVCDRALLGAFTEEKPMVSRQLVREAAAEVSGNQRPSRVSGWLPEAIVAALVLSGVALTGWFIVDRSGFGNDDKALASTTAMNTAEAPADPDNAAAARSSLRLSKRLSTLEQHDGPKIIRGPALVEILASAGSLTGTDAAMRGLAQLWGVTLVDQTKPACEQVRDLNLKCEFQVGSWTQLKQIDRPAILSLVAPGGQTHQLVVAGLGPTHARLVLGTEFVEVPIEQIHDLWFGEYLLLWKPNPLADSLMVPGIRSDGVGWLRNQLEKLQGGEVSASNYYDRQLTERVRQFQRDYQLEVDGKAGVQTLIALNNVIASVDGPKLRSVR